MERRWKNMQEPLIPTGKENVKESIIAIGQELIKRASDIANDLKLVTNIEIYANLTPHEVTNFDITKKYVATFEEKEEK